ncbi:MAG: rhomboid family intramembrane serine protease [Gaiellaceae bacterium]
MLPLKDNVPTRHFPILTVGLIAANVAVFVLYQDGGQGRGFVSSVNELAYQPCELDSSCRQIGEDWFVNIFTSMFMHGGWGHLLGNMLFLWIFGNNVEDTLGRFRFILFYVAGGLAATAAQTFVTLAYGTQQDAQIPNLGASGAIAAVLGAYFILHPRGWVLTLVLPFFFFEIPAFIFLGIYFVFQLVIGGYSFVHPEAGGGVAYFAHLGGIAFGLLTVKLFSAGRPRPLRPSY